MQGRAHRRIFLEKTHQKIHTTVTHTHKRCHYSPQPHQFLRFNNIVTSMSSSPGEQRTVATDALATLGTVLIPGKEQRDAIHLAVEPVVAGEVLAPNQDVGFLPDGRVGRCNHPVGKVDPFLKRNLQAGETFWLVVYPGKIKSLRHVWEHPSIPVARVMATCSSSTSSSDIARARPATISIPIATNNVPVTASTSFLVHASAASAAAPSTNVSSTAAIAPVGQPSLPQVLTVTSVLQPIGTGMMSIPTDNNEEGEEEADEEEGEEEEEEEEGEGEDPPTPASDDPTVQKSRRWIEDYAAELSNDSDDEDSDASGGNNNDYYYRREHVSADELIDGARKWLRSGEYLTKGAIFEGERLNANFWHHYSVVTGKIVPEDRCDSDFFSCSC